MERETGASLAFHFLTDKHRRPFKTSISPDMGHGVLLRAFLLNSESEIERNGVCFSDLINVTNSALGVRSCACFGAASANMPTLARGLPTMFANLCPVAI